MNNNELREKIKDYFLSQSIAFPNAFFDGLYSVIESNQPEQVEVEIKETETALHLITKENFYFLKETIAGYRPEAAKKRLEDFCHRFNLKVVNEDGVE